MNSQESTFSSYLSTSVHVLLQNNHTIAAKKANHCLLINKTCSYSLAVNAVKYKHIYICREFVCYLKDV